MHLLVVSDVAAAARELETGLAPAGIQARFVPLATAAEALPPLAEADPDAAIAIDCADLRDALPLLRALRRADMVLPIVVLARGATAEIERDVFNLGADALVARASACVTLPARLAAIRRRILRRKAPVLRCGNVALDRSAGTLSVDGTAVEVTPCELNVLEALMSAQGVTLGKDVLGKHLQHDDPEQGGAILRVFVCRVRRKLAARGADDIIQTVWGVGYRVEPPARRPAAAARPATAGTLLAA
ncbi:winged helix-turn-helix transcriptional regulator [Falsiroseomonas sp. CW058]|uniref:winged helix-turn-helix transcriptional regulator n=1 Tax=Falsiroseomonas sp. CW058 TaxID=3388664 RepID=UPI003D3113B9